MKNDIGSQKKNTFIGLVFDWAQNSRMIYFLPRLTTSDRAGYVLDYSVASPRARCMLLFVYLLLALLKSLLVSIREYFKNVFEN